MHAALILCAPGLARRGDLGIVPMTAIAPSVAEWLRLTLAREAGEGLELWARRFPGAPPPTAPRSTTPSWYYGVVADQAVVSPLSNPSANTSPGTGMISSAGSQPGFAPSPA